MKEPTEEQREAWNLAQIQQRRSRLVAKPISSIIRQRLASSGYAESQFSAQLQAQWEQAVGPALAKLSRLGSVTRGALTVEVANSASMQEIHFRKKQILTAFQEDAAAKQITDLKIRVGKFD